MGIAGCLVCALALAAGDGEGGGAAPGPERETPSGPARAAPFQLEFQLDRIGGRSAAEALAMVRRLAARHLPSYRVQALDVTKPWEAGGERALVVGEVTSHPRDEKLIRVMGRGLDDAAVAKLARPHPVTVLVVQGPGAERRAVLHALTALVADAASALGAVVDDVEARRWDAPALFADEVARAGFEGELPVAFRHFAIHTYETDGGELRSVTVGLSKLGLPDLCVNGHTSNDTTGLDWLMNAVAQALLEGAPTARGRLELDVGALRARTLREILQGFTHPGAAGRASIALRRVEPEEGDADNALLELTFEGARGGTVTARQQTVLGQLFGSADGVIHVEHDAALLAARERALARLRALKPAFLSGRQPGEALYVKAPFKTRRGGNEWMWVEVRSWEGTRIRGILVNDPDDVAALRGGDRVVVEEGELFDYIHQLPDGTEEGNETRPLLERSAGAGASDDDGP